VPSLTSSLSIDALGEWLWRGCAELSWAGLRWRLLS
jgi:hypothetical protein